ncbi:hypothetical protein GCM10023084_81440 [Streptomyces lacrimifluminis]|uniref:Uncharacterized protein n=2 Tax=Streptomyces lacrimifluminis TaxID=1500077 RepID=A0A917PCZ2_9ACTN|nr:hypothetical protein GCM10012282_80270 [Streptomyces lacrimifluminis]
MDPRAWPDVRDPGSVEEVREAFGRRYWIQYLLHAGVIEVRDIGWAGLSTGTNEGTEGLGQRWPRSPAPVLELNR